MRSLGRRTLVGSNAPNAIGGTERTRPAGRGAAMVDGNLVHGVPGHDHVSKKQLSNKNRMSRSLLTS